MTAGCGRTWEADAAHLVLIAFLNRRPEANIKTTSKNACGEGPKLAITPMVLIDAEQENIILLPSNESNMERKNGAK